MKYIYWGFFWAIVYLFIIMLPLSVLMVGSTPSGYGFAYDVAVFLGFAGTSMMAATFFLTARFKRAAMPFGIDLVYYFHRQISIIAFFFILVHPVVLIINDTSLLGELTSSYMVSGFGSLISLSLLVIFSLWRKQLEINYETWRIWHLVLAIGAFVLAVLHIEGVGGYITTPAKRVLWALIMACWLFLVLYVRLVKPFFLRRHPYRVEKVIKERGDAWSLVLRPENHEGISFQPGQFAWLTLWSSPFLMKEHPFSISSSAEKQGVIHFTIKELGDFTRTIKNVVLGQIAYLDGPYGSFSFDRHPAAGYFFVAGGIGIAPVMGMLRTFADRKDPRPLHLIYAYSSLDNLTFYEEIESLRNQLNLQVNYVLKAPPDNWQGDKGILSAEIIEHHLPDNFKELDYFVCGPVPMIELVEKTLNQRGVSLSSIHSELFDLV